MNDTLQVIGSAMRAEADVLRTIGQNIANSETVAYRRQVPTTRVQFDELLGASTTSQLQSMRTEQAIAVDLKPATLKSTAEPLNLGLDGPGFFVMQSSQGLLLTRRGDFRVSSDGSLVSFSGETVMGEKGAIQIGATKPVIASDGTISVEGNVIDRLRVANVIDPARLESLGDGTFRVDADNLLEGDKSTSVRQGFLEGSNVVPINEMIQLMETVRRFEAEQKFARAYDGMLDKAISELGKI